MASASIHDAIVVGAGPAGATAARTLAAAGARTLLVDRATFPRYKACGGAITTRALTRFPYLPAALARVSTRWISKLVLQGPSGTSAQLCSQTPAVLTIRRIEFDDLLVALAREAGAELLAATEVHDVREETDCVRLQTRDHRILTGRMVIAADGVHGVVARRLGLTRAWPREGLAVDLMEETPSSILRASDPDALWVRYGFPASAAGGPEGLRAGYAYVFPKRGYVNVGVGYLSSEYRRTYRGNAYALHHALVDVLTREGILAGQPCRGGFTPFLIPVGGPLRRTGTSRALVAGDAGGFVNAFSAEGIYYAMVSGDLAAGSLVEALRTGKSAGPLYERRWSREIGRELAESVALQRFLFADGRRIDRLVAGAATANSVIDALVTWATGAGSYAALRRNVAFRNPLAAIVVGALLLRNRISYCAS